MNGMNKTVVFLYRGARKNLFIKYTLSSPEILPDDRQYNIISTTYCFQEITTLFSCKIFFWNFRNVIELCMHSDLTMRCHWYYCIVLIEYFRLVYFDNILLCNHCTIQQYILNVFWCFKSCRIEHSHIFSHDHLYNISLVDFNWMDSIYSMYSTKQ